MALKYDVIIPVYNGVQKLERTIQSLLQQSSIASGQDSFSCLIVDGASTDGTIDLARSFQDPRIHVISEPDSGMYHALTKGLKRAQGDVCCYLPAGEFFEPSAFSTVSEIFTTHRDVHWLTGMNVLRNEKLQTINVFTPPAFKRKFFTKGLYGTRLHVVQQESTFWRTTLNELIDLERLAACRLAGDFFLWKCFAKQHELHVVSSILSGFTSEEGQLSGQIPGGYRKELKSLRDRPSVFEEIHAMVLREVYKHKRFDPRKSGAFYYDLDRKRWARG
ncbi:glycosyltransferase [Cognatishimia sp. SS12]|nr:glycosyltransferase [Cognatishimia sp. SS12]MDC0738756.1 glycosyltransferase [Cognatishimia sp. SS12]